MHESTALRKTSGRCEQKEESTTNAVEKFAAACLRAVPKEQLLVSVRQYTVSWDDHDIVPCLYASPKYQGKLNKKN